MSVRKRRWRGKDGRVREKWMIHIEYTHPDGRRQPIRKVSPVQTRRGAERFERDVRQALLDGSYGKEAAEPTPILAAFAKEFMANYVQVNNKHSTIQTKRAILEHHLVPFFGGTRLDGVGLREIESYKASRLKTHEPKTINNHLSVLRKLLVVAQEWGIIEHVPAIKWLKAGRPEFRFLDFDEVARLLVAAEGEPLWHTMILVALNTGLRQGELLALEWGDIDLKAGRLVVRRAVARGVVDTPKSGRQRELPLNDRTLAALRSHRHLRSDLVFANEDGSMLTKGRCKWPLRRAQRRAGIVSLGWHDLRHSFASHLVMLGATIKEVQELMGHATIEMTMRYAHLTPAVKRGAVALLDGSHSTYTAQERGLKTNRVASPS